MSNHKVTTSTTTSTTAAAGTDNEETTAVDVVPIASLMGKVQEAALEATLISKLQTALDDNMYLVSVVIKDQGYDRPEAAAVFSPVWERDDPSKITLDVTMRITTR